MHLLRLSSSCAAFGLLLALAGCASSPRPGTEALVGVWTVYTPADAARLKPAERAAVAAAGVTADDIAAGRLVGVHCAMMTDGWWSSMGVLPAGMAAARGRVLRMRVADVGTNDRDAVNHVLEALPAPLVSGQLAYRIIPNWRELGLRTNFERIALPPELRDRYEVVQGSYLIKCRQ